MKMRRQFAMRSITLNALLLVTWMVPFAVYSDDSLPGDVIKNQIQEAIRSRSFDVANVAVVTHNSAMAITIDGTFAPSRLAQSRQEFQSAELGSWKSAVAKDLAMQSFEEIRTALPLNESEEFVELSGDATPSGASFKYQRRLSAVDIEDGVIIISLDNQGQLTQVSITGPGTLPPAAIAALTASQIEESEVDEIMNERFSQVAHLPTIEIRREANGGRICRSRKVVGAPEPYVIWLADCGMAVCRIDARSGAIVGCEATRVFSPGF